MNWFLMPDNFGFSRSVDISNIVDYELNWTGDSTVYKFTPLNSTFSGTAIASATNIFVEGIGVNQQVSISSDSLVLTRFECVSQPGERVVFTIENGSGEASLNFTSAVPIATAVPEPNALLFLGLVSFGCMSRKKRG